MGAVRKVNGRQRKGKMTQGKKPIDVSIVCAADLLRWSSDHIRDALAALKAERLKFPHRCPRCGLAAYVGLQSVEHQKGGTCD